MPQFIGMIVDQLDVETGIPSLHYIIWVAMGYFGLSIISYLFYYVQGIVLQKSGQKIIYNLRMEVFEHIESMSQKSTQ